MHILIVTQYFWPESFIVNGLATELINKGHRVSVLTGLPNYPEGKYKSGYSLFKGPWREDYHGVSVLRVPILSRKKGFLNLALNYFSFILSGCFFLLFHKIDKLDVIFCFAPSPALSCLPAVFIKWLKRKPLVFWVQDLWPESISAIGAIKSEKIINLVGRVIRFIYKRCDIIMAPSKAFNASIVKWGGFKNKIQYVPNWAEPFVEYSEIPDWVKNLPQGFKIGFAGNIGKAQNMTTLLDAADLLKKYSDVKWIVVGDGSEKKWFEAEIKNRNLQDCIIAISQRPYSDMLPFFNSCNALYLSLTDDYIFSLTVPSKLQAYLSAGRPILASIDGEGANIVSEAKAGFSSPAGNAEELSKNVLKLKELSAEQASQMGENASSYFSNNFEKKLVIDKIINTLSDVSNSAKLE